MRTLILLCVVAAAYAQYEGGFVKILQDKRYHSGSTFGNFRHQEDGIKYKEETDAQGVRRGFYEYPDVDGVVRRVEFEAGPGIGFRIVSSNFHDPTPVAAPRPQFQPRPSPAPVHHTPAPVHHVPTPVHHVPTPIPRHHSQPTFPAFSVTPQPGAQNLFDYPGNLEFSRHGTGHRFKFTAT